MEKVGRSVWVTIVAMVVAAAGFGFSLWIFRDFDAPGELLPAILGPFFAILGTLAGAVAGHAAGAAGAEQAQQQAAQAREAADVAQAKYTAIVERTDPNLVAQLRLDEPQLFG